MQGKEAREGKRDSPIGTLQDLIKTLNCKPKNCKVKREEIYTYILIIINR